MTFPVFAGSNPTGYFLSRSLRFRSSASAYLTRTPASAGNRQIFTYSAWIKRGTLGVRQGIIVCTDAPANNYFDIEFLAADQLDIQGSNGTWRLATSAVYRDPSAWYHIVLAVDTTQATTSNRVKLYVNGSQISAFSTASYPTLNSNCYFNLNAAHSIGSWQPASGLYLDGYLTEVNFIDGQALTPSSFGSTNTLTGVWQPARYGGTYGTNGFYLPFTDNSALTTSSNAGLGKDFSGNGNYWTTNNISITAGVTYDSMTDVPTLTSATAANFAVMNPLDKYSSITVSGGNLNAICADVAWRSGAMTFGNFTTGKWYYEVTATNIGGSTYISAGWELASLNHTAQTGGVGAATGNNFGVLISTGLRQTKVNSSIFSSDSNANANGDVLMIAVDFDAGKGWVGKNGTWYDSGNPSAGTNPCTTTVSGGMTPAYQMYNNGGLSANFGQRPFAYTPPTGYVALNTYNLPTSTIVKGDTAMNIALASGASIKTTTEALFSGQFLEWIKDRVNANNHQLLNGVTGLSNVLQSNTTGAETTYSAPSGNSVGYAWKAGTSSSTNTSGTITSTVSVNASAGFSVVTATSPASGNAFTLGHGLGVAPAFIISKSRSGTGNWSNYHVSTGAGGYLLFTTAAYTANTDTWNNTTPTSSLISTTTNWWGNSANLVFYCWTPIAGYSAFGSLTGNGSADGPFVYTEFQPRWILLKNTTAASSENWYIYDTVRSTYNVIGQYLYPNASGAEGTFTTLDVTSNGFKIRTTNSAFNTSSGTYIYAAFAANPFKYSNAF